MKIKAIIGVALVFVLGTICGTAATHLYYKCRIESILSGRSNFREEHLVSRLDRKLNLDKQQEELVRGIIHETHEELRALRSKARPQMEAIIERSQSKISAILTPEQKKKYEVLISERKEKMRKKGLPFANESSTHR